MITFFVDNGVTYVIFCGNKLKLLSKRLPEISIAGDSFIA